MSKENSLEYWLDYIHTTEPKEIDFGLQRIKHIKAQLIKLSDEVFLPKNCA